MFECAICRDNSIRCLNFTEKGMVCLNCCWKYGLEIYELPLTKKDFIYLPHKLKIVLLKLYPNLFGDLPRNIADKIKEYNYFKNE